ncbi:MAG: hypothetical protein KBT27_16435 [Prevotellaceae bacterium]|nr:hypothetical protein [Candidatus Faecinaster equi]
MKRIIFLTVIAVLTPFLAMAQNLQTKTEKINDETTRTFSFYLNKDGEQVKHGKYTITWKVNKVDRKVDSRLECNYKDGVLHGKLTYSSNQKDYASYLDITAKDMISWKLNMQQLDNFTVDMYEGYMTGDINVTYQGLLSNESNFKGKAVNGVLVDNSELVITERPRRVVNGQLKYLNDAQESKRYKNVLPVTTPNANLQEPIEDISFEFPSNQYGGMETYIIKLPRYVEKPFDKLEDIAEYIFLITYQGDNMDDISRIDEKILQSYYLSQSSKDSVHYHYELAKEQVSERIEAKRQRINERRNTYTDAYSNSKQIVEDFRNKGFWLQSVSNFYQMDGYIYPIVMDVNVRNLLYKGYNKRISDIQEVINSLNLVEYDYDGKILEYEKQTLGGFSPNNKKHELTDETVKTMTDYLQRLKDANIPSSQKQLSKLCEIENGMINQLHAITRYYTKSTYVNGNIMAGSSKIPLFTEENCTVKVTRKKGLYSAFTEVAAYLYDRLSQCSLDEHLEQITSFAKVVEVMEKGRDGNTKDLEKSLKVAQTPEEKLNLFLK